MWPWLLLVVVVRPSFNLFGWLSGCLWLGWLLGWILSNFAGGNNPMLNRVLPPLGWVCAAALCVQVLAFPAEVLFLAPEGWYPWVQAAALVGAGVSSLALARLARDVLVPPRPPRTLREALAAAGRVPQPRGKGGRRARAALESRMPHGVPVVERVRAAVMHRAAVLLRYLAMGLVSVVAGLGALVLTRGAFLEGWAALLVGLFLAAETRVYAWHREDVVDGFAEPDPWAGRTLYDAWWGASAGLALVITLRTTAAMGGLRPEPVWWYVVVFSAALVAAILPFRWARSRSSRLFAGWLRARPARRAELEAVRDAWRGNPASFGRLPEG